MKNFDAPVPSATELITSHIAELGGWRGETLTKIRRLILDADARVVEEWKWTGTPVWSRNGIVCMSETYQHAVTITFVKGAALTDSKRLFNSDLESRQRRTIELREGEGVHAASFQALVRQAIALNAARKTRSSQKAKNKE
jgi:hypothetical protein